MKTCHLCKESFDLSFFGKDKHSKDGHTYACKVCRNKRGVEYHKANPHVRKKINDNNKEWRKEYYSKPETKRKYKNDSLKLAFGITIEQYDEMLTNQNGVCAICFKPERTVRNKSLAVDHCHTTGKIRGLLCSHCNRAIGLLDDNIEFLNNGVTYLQKAKDEA